MPSTVVQSGDYLLQLDTGFDSTSFRLNSTTRGILNTNILGPQPTDFAEINQYVTSIVYNRGRRKTDYQFGAGTMTFTMLDTTGILGPYDSSSPYYDPIDQRPGLAPMRTILLSREGQYLFQGIVTGYTYEFALAGPNTVTVTCADDFYKLAQTQLDTYNVSAQLSGARITSVLDLPEVNYGGGRDIATGTVNMGHDSSYTVPQGTNTLKYLQQINDAEQGRLFMSNDGKLTFQNRIGGTLSPAVIAFNDDGTGAKYQDIEVEFDADNVVNRTYIQALDGKTATVSDTASITKYFIQQKTITDSLLHEQSEINNLATYLIEPEPEPRYTSITASFMALTSLERAAAASVDIGDTISIDKMIPGLGSQINETVAVEGIYGVIDVNRGHTITYYTSPTTILYTLILNDVLYGKLNFNALG